MVLFCSGAPGVRCHVMMSDHMGLLLDKHNIIHSINNNSMNKKGGATCPSPPTATSESENPYDMKQSKSPTVRHKLFTAISAIYWLTITGFVVPFVCIALYYLLLLPIAMLKLVKNC